MTSIYFAPLATVDQTNCQRIQSNEDAYSVPPCQAQFSPVQISDNVITGLNMQMYQVALVGCLLALIFGAVLLIFSSRQPSEERMFNAKRGVIAGVLGAFFIGALVPMINWLITRGEMLFR